ncbi:MAG: CDP-glucose 4,6-dehydratase, partial [Firmicutes bacterium]|nr:CDP-glucose 4,6-dehydratase [Bacillota bacterium]
YVDPVYTYETNVMGTVNILESIRYSDSVKSFLNVTTDKVYENKEWEWGYRENDPLDGYDPYSNSKSCSELVTHSFKKCFLSDRQVAISTARAGNVIGGGDFAKDRIIPDCIKAAQNCEPIILRNPHSIRPYQHVLEPLFAYLLILERQFNHPEVSDYYNVGPNEEDCITTGELVSKFCEKWGNGQKWESKNINGPHEANYLKLDCSKIKTKLGWKPHWNVEISVDKTVEWTKNYFSGEKMTDFMKEQIIEFIGKK